MAKTSAIQAHSLGLLRIIAGLLGCLKMLWMRGTCTAYAVNHPDIQAWSAKTGNPVKAYDSTAETKKALMDTLNFFKKFKSVL